MQLSKCIIRLDRIAANLSNAVDERRARERLNKVIHAYTVHRSFDSVPVEEFVKIIERYKFRADEFKSQDFTAEAGEHHVQIGPRTVFYITWHRKDDKSPFKIVAYAS